MTQVPTAANAVRLWRLGKQVVLLLGRLLPPGDQSNRRRSMVHTSLALIERHLWTADDSSWHHHSLLLCLSVVAMGSTIVSASALNVASSPRTHLSRWYPAAQRVYLGCISDYVGLFIKIHRTLA